MIAPGRGLLPADVLIRVEDLRKMATVPVDQSEPAFREPLVRDATALHRGLAADDRIVLLGSVATDKYVAVLTGIFGDRVRFPLEFVGRGDMSRGGLMLRCAYSGQELSYVLIRGAPRRGERPAGRLFLSGKDRGTGGLRIAE